MTPRQEKFCLEYAASGNAYHSALNAGYSENYAKGNVSKLLENESVKKRLQELKEKAESEKIADIKEMQEKLTAIIQNNNIQSVTIVRMEVPCCGGLEMAAKKALQNSGKFIPWQVVTISIDGNIME